jgi:hypothetical protein
VRWEAIGAIAQDGGDHFGVGDHEELALGEAEAEILAVSTAPLFGDEVQPRRIDFQQVADQRPAARAGEIADFPRRGASNCGRAGNFAALHGPSPGGGFPVQNSNSPNPTGALQC